MTKTKTYKKFISIFAIGLITFNFMSPALGNTNGTNSLLNSIIKEYQLNNKTMKISSGESSLVNRILVSNFSKTKRTNLGAHLKGKVPSNIESKVKDRLILSMKDNQKQSYRLIIETKYSLQEIVQALGYFDKTQVDYLYSNDQGMNYFEIRFNYKGSFGLLLGKYLDSGEVPENLFTGIRIINPFYVKLNYLTGEKLTSMWGITKIGADKYQQGLMNKTKVKVGVIDTGVDYTHGDLEGNIYVNMGEISGNGIDDDKNGYIDDIKGYNFIGNNINSNDDHGHGTHVAGIIGGMVNGTGIFGVNSNTSIVPLKVLDANGYGSSYSVIDAINYAAKNDIKIINMSLGGDGNPATDIMCTAITNAKSKGVISIVAAGNENASVSGKVPAGCADVITVGAVDSNLNKASFSNYGTKVELAAPGVNIYSTYYLNRYASMNGTSMATPFVAGLASAVLANNPNHNTDTMRTLLVTNSDAITSTNIGKLINMNKVMSAIGVSQDGEIVNNILPQLDLVLNRLWLNHYEIVSTATDQDGVITKYEYYVDGVLKTSGEALTKYTLTITDNTTVKVKVLDNAGGTAEKSLELVYEQPANILPMLEVSATKLGANNYEIVSNATDQDGVISKYEYYVDGVLKASGEAMTKYALSITDNTTVKVKVLDNAGGTAEKTVELVYEQPANILPVLDVTVNKVSTNNYEINAFASDTDGVITKYEYYVDGVLKASGEAMTKYALSITDNTTVKVKVLDNAGGTAEKSLELVYEQPVNVLPVLEVIATKLGVNNYEILAEATDQDGVITKYEYYVNGVLKASGESMTKYTLSITANTTVKVRVTDNIGGISEKSVYLTYEKPANMLPLLDLTTTKISENKYSITTKASDPDGKIVKYQYYVNGKLAASSSTLTSYTLTIKTNTTVKVRVTDNVGGITEKSVYLTYVKPNSFPVLSISSTKISKGTYTITAKASDSDGTIVKYEYFVNNVLKASGQTLTSYTVTISSNSIVKVRVTDNAGGIAEKSISLRF